MIIPKEQPPHPEMINMIFIKENALTIILKELDWKIVKPKKHNGLVIFKPDFYPTGEIFAITSKGKWAYCSGESIIEYKGQTFNSVEKLLLKFGNESIDDISNWNFIEEKEWVVTKNGSQFLGSFTTLDTLRKSTKYR